MEARLHWVRLTLPEASRTPVERLVEFLWSQQPPAKYPGLWRYDTRSQWACGVRLYYSTSKEARDRQRGTICLDVPGAALDALDLDGFKRLLFRTEEIGARPARLDVNFDDFERVIEPHELEDHYVAGAVIGFRTWQGKSRRTGKLRAICHNEADFGNRGSSGSGKYLRVYDKRPESKGENEAIRWELELTNDGHSFKAELAWSLLLVALEGDETGERFGKACAQLVTGSIDFREPKDASKDRHAARRTRLPWWQKLVDVAGGRVSLGGVRRKTTISEKREWLGTQVVRNLAIVGEIAERAGPGFAAFCEKLRSRGVDRLTPTDRQMIEDYFRDSAEPWDSS